MNWNSSELYAIVFFMKCALTTWISSKSKLRKGKPLTQKKQRQKQKNKWQFITVRQRPLTAVQAEPQLRLWLIVQVKN